MTEPDEVWRPLGVDEDEDEIAKYDALHEGVPPWLETPIWEWIRRSLSVTKVVHGGYNLDGEQVVVLEVELYEAMCQTLQIPSPSMRGFDPFLGASQITAAIAALSKHDQPLQVVDYLLAHGGHGSDTALGAVLERGKSGWTIGTRAGRTGLTRRVPRGVQLATDAVIAQSGRAGNRLAKAWEALFGIQPDPSKAYRLAIQAVEDAAVPVVSPSNGSATLGTVLSQMQDQKNWQLPMARQHADAPTTSVLIGMMRMLWHGQHDRHGGQPTAPGDVCAEEAIVAVGLAVTLVQWFEAGLVKRI